MNSASSPAAHTSKSTKSVELVGALFKQTLCVGKRHLDQFAGLAALARIIADEYATDHERGPLFKLLERLASDGAENARLDVELFEGLLAGQLIQRFIGIERT